MTPNSVLFFERYPFMGVELLDLITDHFSLLFYYDDASYRMLKELGYSVLTYSNSNFLRKIDSDKAVGLILSDEQYINNIIKKTHGKAIFFYMSREMSDLCKKQNLTALLPPYKLQEKLGNKLLLSNICKRTGVETHNSINIRFSEGNAEKFYKYCQKKVGTPFVIQGGIGVSGEDTYKIDSFRDFASLSKNIKGNFRVTKYLENVIPLSVHICITKKEILYEGPYIQIIGFRELANSFFQFSGNDTNQTMLSEELKRKVKFQSLKLATYARDQGYRGILGIDFIWSKYEKRVLVQEINSRLVGLTRLLTGIQKEQNITPHLIKHINEFLPMQIPKVKKRLNLYAKNYSQLYIANNTDGKVKVRRYLMPGIYKVKYNQLIRTKDSLFLKDMERDEVLINFSAYKNSLLIPDAIMAKIILKKSVLKRNSFHLSEDALKLISLIRYYIVS